MSLLRVILLISVYCCVALAQLRTGQTSTSTSLKTQILQVDTESLWLRNGTINPKVLSAFPSNLRTVYGIVSTNSFFNLKRIKNAQDLKILLNQFGGLSTAQITTLTTLVSTATSTVTTTAIQGIPLAVFAAGNVSQIRAMDSRMTATQRQTICLRLVREPQAPETVGDIMEGIDCLGTIRSSGLGPSLERPVAEALIRKMVARKPTSSWTNTDWTDAIEMFQGLSGSLLQRMPNPIVLSNLQRIVRPVAKFDPCLRRAFIDKLIHAVGGPRNITVTQFRDLQPVIKYMEPSMLSQLSPAVLPAVIATIAKDKMDDSNVKNEIIDSLTKHFGPPSNWTRAQVKSGIKMLGSLEGTIMQVNRSLIKDALKDIGEARMSPRKAEVFAKILLKDNKLRHPGNWSNSTMLKQARHILPGLPIDFLKNISGQALLGAFKELSESELSKAQLRAIFDKVKVILPKPLGQFNKTEIMQNKGMLKAMTSEELNRLNATELRDALAELGDDAGLKRSQRQSALNRLGTLPGGLQANVDKMGKFSRRVPTKILKRASNANLGLNGTRSQDDMEIDQAKELWKRIKQMQGGVADPKFTPEKIKRYKCALLGMSVDDVKALPKGRATMAVIDEVCKCAQRNRAPNTLLQALAIKMKAMFNMTASNLTARVDRNSIQISRCLFKYFSENELKQFGQHHCGDVVCNLGQVPDDDIDKKQIKALARFAISCLKNNQPGQLDSGKLKKMGNLVCGIEDFTQLNRTGLNNFITKLACKCQYDAKMRRQLLDRFVASNNLNLNNITSSKPLRKMSCLLADLTANEQNAIPANVLLDICQDLTDGAEERKAKVASRKKLGQRNDNSDADEKMYEDGKNRLQQLCLQARRQAAAGGTGGTGRRRRQTGAITCSMLKAMGSSVTSLSSSQITSISDTEFINCADFLGNETGWTTSQKSDLVTIAKKSTVWGTPNTWTTSNLQDAGTIAQGLTAAEIATLTLTSMDGIGDLGDFDGWTTSQLTDGFAKWLTDYKAGNTSGINSTELTSLGHFACGATSSHIASITSAEYAGAAADIGQLDSCTHTLSDWAVHAKATYGHPTNWTASDISSAGVVIGGLTASELSGLSSTQIQSLSTTVIPNLPSSTLASLSTTQLGYMSSAQATAITATQQAAMTSAQLLVIQSLGASLYTSSAMSVLPTISALLMALIALMM